MGCSNPLGKTIPRYFTPLERKIRSKKDENVNTPPFRPYPNRRSTGAEGPAHPHRGIPSLLPFLLRFPFLSGFLTIFVSPFLPK